VLLGRDPFDSSGCHAAMNAAITPSFSTASRSAVPPASIFALFDLTGRLPRPKGSAALGTQGTIASHPQLDPQSKTLDDVEGLVAQSRSAVPPLQRQGRADPKYDLELCRLVKRLVPDGFLWADANGGYDEATALEVAPKLADVGVRFEQPSGERLGGYRR
jgi:muconate cycloisomerase